MDLSCLLKYSVMMMRIMCSLFLLVIFCCICYCLFHFPIVFESSFLINEIFLLSCDIYASMSWCICLDVFRICLSLFLLFDNFNGGEVYSQGEWDGILIFVWGNLTRSNTLPLFYLFVHLLNRCVDIIKKWENVNPCTCRYNDYCN